MKSPAIHIFLFVFLGLCFSAAGAEEVERKEPLRVDLETAIKLGSARNFNLRSVKARARSVNQIATESWMAYLPAASVSLERTRALVTGDTDSQATEVRLNLEQVIYDGGARDLTLGMARLEKAMLGHEYRRDENQLRVEIQNRFLSALAARGKVQLNRRSLRRSREQLRLSRLEEKAGFITRTEVFLVAARVRQIELSLRRAENAYIQALYELKLVMNLDAATDIDPIGDIFYDFIYDPPEVDIDELARNARKSHPEVLRSHTNVYRRLKEKKMADNSWIPRLTMGGYVGRQGESLPVRNDTWGVNFALTFPLSSSTATSTGSLDVAGNGSSRTGTNVNQLNLFDNLSYGRARLEARTAYSRAIDDHKQLVNRVTIDVQRRFQDLQEAWESIRIGNGRVYFQLSSLRVASKQFEVGQNRRADILQSEVDLVQAQEDLTDDLASYLIAAYALELSAAVDPGTLELYEYEPGEGNTLLAHLLKDDFKTIRDIKPPDEKDADYFDDSFEINKIQLDETSRRARPAGEPRLTERVRIVPREERSRTTPATNPVRNPAPRAAEAKRARNSNAGMSSAPPETFELEPDVSAELRAAPGLAHTSLPHDDEAEQAERKTTDETPSTPSTPDPVTISPVEIESVDDIVPLEELDDEIPLPAYLIKDGQMSAGPVAGLKQHGGPGPPALHHGTEP